jgi:hypothetical protein
LGQNILGQKYFEDKNDEKRELYTYTDQSFSPFLAQKMKLD